MSTKKYEMWLNYDNDKTKFMFPVLPGSITFNYEGIASSSDIDKFGETFHKGKRKAGKISFSSYFPAEYTSSCNCSSKLFEKPKAWKKYILELMDASKPAHFVLTNGPMAVDIYVIITSFSATENGGDVGTLNYSIEMKEFRPVSITKYVKKSSGTKKKTVKKKSSSRVSNKKKTRTYTVKSGDCLWNIAKKFYGNGAQYTKIVAANKSKIKNPNVIQPGWKLTIP